MKSAKKWYAPWGAQDCAQLGIECWAATTTTAVFRAEVHVKYARELTTATTVSLVRLWLRCPRWDDLLAKCLELEPSSPLRMITDKLVLFPDVGARYRVDEIAPRDLWRMYYAAQTAGSTVLKPMNDRNTASTIRLQT